MYVPMLHDAQPTRLTAATERTSKSANSYALSDSASLMHQNGRQLDILSPQHPFRVSFLNILGCLWVRYVQHVRLHPLLLLNNTFRPEPHQALFIYKMSVQHAQKGSQIYMRMLHVSETR